MSTQQGVVDLPQKSDPPPDSRDAARAMITALRGELDETTDRILHHLARVEPGVQEDLRKYLCIRFSGYLEQILFQAISGHVREDLRPEIRSFIGSFFRQAPNLNPHQFQELVAKFGDSAKSSFADFLSADLRKDRLRALLELRNDVAHGRAYTGTVASLEGYRELVADIEAWVVSQWLDG